ARVRQEDNGRYLGLEVDPTTKRGITFGGWGLRVYADTLTNLMPGVIEIYDIRRGEPVLLARMTVQKRKGIAKGLLGPVKGVMEFFGGKEHGKVQQVTNAKTLTVDLSRSKWNQPLSEDQFRVAFPAGVKVIDEIHEIAFVTGKNDPGRNLNDLAANARDIIRN